MKKIFIIILLCLSFTAYGEDELIVETSVTINDQYLFADTSHILVDDTVYVVGKYLVEALGGHIEWFGQTQTVRITLEDDVIDLVIDQESALVNGQPVELYKAAFIKDGRTMLPVKFVADQLHCQVAWDQETYTVNIIKEGIDVDQDYIYERPYTDEDLLYLAKITTVESGEASLEMALAIANTVLNRVKDDRFPNTVKEVIFQVDKYVQFPPAHKDSFTDLKPKYLSTIAAKKALEGINNIENSLYFNNQPFKSKADDLIRIIDGEYFYK